tara:strand:- start:96 stop:1634 length:1539 start_codon:yes stop_codon:yes gene_type:complete
MRFIQVFLFTQLFIFGQTLPTVPNNVFRVSMSKNISNSIWRLPNNQFSLHNIGRNYFDYITHNDSIRFSSNFDLYHNGTTYIDSITTIEKWLNDFNQYYGFSLPVFEAQDIDTSKIIAPYGMFSEDRKREIISSTLTIEYGLTNEITLKVLLPIIDSYDLTQTLPNYSVNNIDGVQKLLDYHINAKDSLNKFINSNNFSNLPRRGLKDTLRHIFELFYSDTGKYSVKWAFHSLDDPINNLLINSRFLPPGIDKDSVSIDDLVSYYYPGKKNGSGIDDIKIGVTALLHGNPSWDINDSKTVIYGQFFLTIPYGKTLSQFLDIRRKQFNETKIGSGSSRLSCGIYVNKTIDFSLIRRIYFQTKIDFSTTTTLNTPISFFSGGHTHPDTILNIVGNTYKYSMGTGYNLNAGIETEGIKNRLLLRTELLSQYKSNDNYISKDKEWDKWMEKYAGNSPSFSLVDFKIEIWLLNSFSKYQLGPIPFDIYGGIITTINSNNIYSGWNAYTGITTYFQGW